MKTYLIFLATFIIQIFDCKNRSVLNDRAGVKLAASQKIILDFQKKYLPLLISKIGQISIPDQSVELDVKIGTLHINLSQIIISITNLLSDDISVQFSEPNLVSVFANKISGNGNFNVKFKLGFISETDRVLVDVKRVDAQVTLSLGTIDSSKIPGKLIPTATITKINLNLDFDFEIHGSLIAKIADLVKGTIKSIINDQLQQNIKGIIVENVNNLIAESVEKLPIYIPIGVYDLVVDYSLLSPPKVINDYLIFNSNGAIVNLKNQESLVNPYVIPDNMPDYDEGGKLAQGFLSDFSINTAFRTLHLTKLLKIRVDSNDIPADSPVQLNTTSLDLIINGISEVYGKDRLVEVECNTEYEPPKIILNEDEAVGEVIGKCTILAQIENTTNYDVALQFNTTITAGANAELSEDGNITGKINKIHLKNSQIIFSKIPKANVQNLENLINFSSNLIIPFINNKYLKYLTIPIPSYDGIYFNDSKMKIHKNFFELNLTPILKLTKFEEKEKIKNKKEFEFKLVYLGF